MSSKAPRGEGLGRDTIRGAFADAYNKKRMAPKKILAVLETISVEA